ncbi:WD40-repeat-containing domain protein [Pelagophyceae sp. CCMP2097]|nr:WD40-repeat-containing domain protein [Pelagophyceae sp. CCMP2097]
MAEMRVHRCRFAEWTPAAIVAVAAKPDSAEVCLARDDGSFELIDGDLRWTAVERVAGRRDVVATCLVWCGGRWFGGGVNGIIFEVRFDKGCVAGAVDAMGGAVWHLARDPLQMDRFACACDDGTLRLFAANDSDFGAVDYVGALRAATGAKALCVAWSAVGSSPVVFAGCDDATIRRVDASTGHASLRLTLAAETEKRILVWAVANVPDDDNCTIVSGDSAGCVTLWDGAVGVQLRRFRRHDADVLAVVATKDTIFAAGVDPKVACFEAVSVDGVAQWAYAATHRAHVLDVRGLALVKTSDGKSSLVSAALDAKLCVYGALRSAKRPTRIWPFPHHAIVNAVEKSRLLAVCHSDRVDVWSLRAADAPETDAAFALALRIKAPAPHNIACFAMGDNDEGALVAISDGVSKTRLLQLAFQGGALSAKLVETLPAALALKICGNVLVLVEAAKVTLYTIDASTLTQKNCVALEGRPHTLIAVSGDRVAVAPYCGEHIVLVTNGAPLTVSAPGRACALALVRKGNVLVSATSKGHGFEAFDVTALAAGSADAPESLAGVRAALASLAGAVRHRNDAAIGLAVGGASLVAYSHGFIAVVNLDEAQPAKTLTSPVKSPSKKKAAAALKKDAKEAPLSTRYTPLLAAAFLSPGELVVAENPWLAIARQQTLKPIKRKRFGT